MFVRAQVLFRSLGRGQHLLLVGVHFDFHNLPVLQNRLDSLPTVCTEEVEVSVPFKYHLLLPAYRKHLFDADFGVHEGLALGFRLQDLLQRLERPPSVHRTLHLVVVVQHEDHFICLAAHEDLGYSLLVVEEVSHVHISVVCT